ncbi:hypothetical protein K450DRAFT_229770 [Umbelopsis ramanniana AG]|uniref:Uncharacterized protein n=1 Tax=Umbelopsis ramanniana AG TaxID=1314678 RepID=A0AAD5HH75_UMBRA|nr:uncharacterized protein K450DRAFT_229770 [Umbelopsis ramanniana AG]KAI8581898.1 hypothetical protein K450DRAFT_229770 [Umbelopsis ramanniana AG]
MYLYNAGSCMKYTTTTQKFSYNWWFFAFLLLISISLQSQGAPRIFIFFHSKQLQ